MLIHADADAFFASVEARDDPALRDRPFVVAAQVVACASYAARSLGVHSGMPRGQALRIRPDLVVVEPRYAAYQQASMDLFALFRSYTSWVEAGSMEEAFIDVRPQGRDPTTTAREIRGRAWEELGLPVSMGVGRTKLMAKVASRRAKPDGMVVISAAEDPVVRRGLRLEQVWGVGPPTVAALAARGIRTVADLEGLAARDLVPDVGTMLARRLVAVASATDDATIRQPGPRRSAGAQRSISGTTRSRTVVEDVFAGVVTSALGRIGEPGIEVTKVEVEVRFDDGGTELVGRRLDPATSDPDAVRAAAVGLLAETGFEEDGRGIRLVGVNLFLRPPVIDPAQLTLFPSG